MGKKNKDSQEVIAIRRKKLAANGALKRLEDTNKHAPAYSRYLADAIRLLEELVGDPVPLIDPWRDQEDYQYYKAKLEQLRREQPALSANDTRRYIERSGPATVNASFEQQRQKLLGRHYSGPVSRRRGQARPSREQSERTALLGEDYEQQQRDKASEQPMTVVLRRTGDRDSILPPLTVDPLLLPPVLDDQKASRVIHPEYKKSSNRTRSFFACLCCDSGDTSDSDSEDVDFRIR